ncbi:hypothetical protein BSL78_07883 [Apostichopus japonicus]|uniref:Uncharacterized protein n=1 Tax=Stichopus japonicus TaxID=307972 RepID=A0A2G8L4G0_STIJA|nr:hypothetical protein BSL78_07883 [Apostichopus japonicus]
MAGDGSDWFSLKTNDLDVTSGSVIQGSRLFVETDILHIEATAELSVSGGGFSDNGRGKTVYSSGGHHVGQGGLGQHVSAQLFTRDIRRHCLTRDVWRSRRVQTTERSNHSDGESSDSSLNIHASAGGGAGGSIWIEADQFTTTGIISASGGDGRPDAGGGSGGLISVSYEDAFIRDNPVAYGGSGLQQGASGVVYLQKLTSGDVHSKLIVDNGGQNTPRETQLQVKSKMLSLEHLQVTNGGRFVPLKAFSGPTNLCVYTGEMVGDVSSSITVSRGILFHLSACGCPSCQYGQKPSIDIDTHIKVEQDGLLRVPEEVSVGYGVTIDICGTLDGLQDGHMSLYRGAKFRASYPANSGSYNSTVSSLVIKDVDIFKDSYFGGSSSCPSTKTLTLFSEIFSINYGGTFDQNSFTVDNSTNVESSVIIEGGATLILEGSWDGNGTTSITTEDLVVGAGGLITAVGGGLAETGELQCGHDSASLGALYEPRFYGSGGTLVSGGGQVSLDVTNRTHLDGTIDVSGEDHYSSVSSGNGGSGGSILIKTETLSGFGLMQTSGGNTLTGCGGSGGRIAVHIGSEMSFVGQFSVAAGEAPNPGRSGVIFVEDHSTDTTKIVIHGSDRLPSLIRKGDLANLTEVDELVVEAGGILQLEESSLKVGMLSGDKTGVIQVTGRATLVVESSSVQGTECSFEVSHNSELELGENVHLSGEVVPVLHLDGTLTTDHIVLGEGTVSFLSSDGFMNVTSVTLEELSHLEIASGATIGRNSSDSQVTLEEYEIGAGAKVVFGSMDTRITANTIVVRSEAKVISSSALQKFYIHAEDIVIEADAVISVDFGGYSDAGVGSPEDTTSGASHGGQGGHLGYLEAGRHMVTLIFQKVLEVAVPVEVTQLEVEGR